jgi:hypothetical protein
MENRRLIGTEYPGSVVIVPVSYPGVIGSVLDQQRIYHRWFPDDILVSRDIFCVRSTSFCTYLFSSDTNCELVALQQNSRDLFQIAVAEFA